MPTTIWLLTGGPAAVYVANKTLSTNAPVTIFSVNPKALSTNTTFTQVQNSPPRHHHHGRLATTAGGPVSVSNGAAAISNGAAASTNKPPTVLVGGTPALVLNSTDTAITAQLTDTKAIASGNPLDVEVVTTSGVSAYFNSAVTVQPPLELLGMTEPGHTAPRLSSPVPLEPPVSIDPLSSPLRGGATAAGTTGPYC